MPVIPLKPRSSFPARFPRLSPTGLHEIHAATEADAAAVAGFSLANAGLKLGAKPNAVILWARHDLMQAEAGQIYPLGLAQFGVAPSAVTMVAAPDVASVLQAGLDAARCAALAAIIVEFRGDAKAYGLTASRRLALAAKASKLPLYVLRHGATIAPSAAETRWSVRGLPSRVAGKPAFEATLLKSRSGPSGEVWSVEWNSETRCFEERLSGGVAAIPRDRAARRAG